MKIEIKGNTESDLELALEEIKEKFSQGFTTGSDRNETGSYYFNTDGEEVEVATAED